MATRGRKPKVETVVARAVMDALQVGKQVQSQPSADNSLARRTRARYDAAGNGRRMRGWTPPSSGPNEALTGIERIRNRSRDSARNDWSGQAAVQKWVTNLIGVGITPRFDRITNKTRRQEIKDLWDDFVRVADADGVLNFYGLQSLAVRAWLDGGEVFIRKRSRFLDEGLPVPMQVQLLESDMVPVFDADTFLGLPANNRIRSGIELDRRNQRVAYWVYRNHPGDRDGTGATQAPLATDLVRVAASEMKHLFEPLRPGQLRGVSMLAPVLARLRNIENYDDATLTRQQLANLVVAFITRKMPDYAGDEDINGFTGEDSEYDQGGKPLQGLQPGLVQELDDGQDVSWSNPPEAGTNYSDYMRTQHMGTAAGAGLPYELFSGDIKEISDRTLRVIVNEFRRHAEQRQWQLLIPIMCESVVRWFAEAAILAGQITIDEAGLVARAKWATHGWAHIHPVQDPQGKKLEVEAGFRSRSSVIGERGDDPEEVDAERALDKEREESLGLYVDPMGNPDPNAADGDTDGIDNNEYFAPPNPSARRDEVFQLALLRRIEAETDALRAKAKAQSAPREPDPNAAAQTELLNRTLALLAPSDEQQ